MKPDATPNIGVNATYEPRAKYAVSVMWETSVSPRLLRDMICASEQNNSEYIRQDVNGCIFCMCLICSGDKDYCHGNTICQFLQGLDGFGVAGGEPHHLQS